MAENKIIGKRFKGSSLLIIPHDYTIIDVETTGYDPRYDEIIEIGCIKYRNFQETSRFQTLIQPPKNRLGEYVDKFIESYTGITNQMLETAPTFAYVVNKLCNFLSGELIVGHNVNFDINFLYDSLVNFEVIFDNDFVNTLRLARRLLPNLKSHRLENLDEYFGLNAEHHRSIKDCETTHQVLLKFAQIVSEHNVDLSKISRRKLDLRSIQADNEVLTENALRGKYCVFTGKLEKFARADAAKFVVNLGGFCENTVTHKTNFLIVGDFNYSSNIKDGKSSKLKKAEQLILQGQDLKILSESVFYDIIKSE